MPVVVSELVAFENSAKANRMRYRNNFTRLVQPIFRPLPCTSEFLARGFTVSQKNKLAFRLQTNGGRRLLPFSVWRRGFRQIAVREKRQSGTVRLLGEARLPLGQLREPGENVVSVKACHQVHVFELQNVMIVDVMNISLIGIIQIVQPFYRINAWKNPHQAISEFWDRHVPIDVQTPVVHFQKDNRLKGFQCLSGPFEHLQLKTFHVNFQKIQTIKRQISQQDIIQRLTGTCWEK